MRARRRVVEGWLCRTRRFGESIRDRQSERPMSNGTDFKKGVQAGRVYCWRRAKPSAKARELEVCMTHATTSILRAYSLSQIAAWPNGCWRARRKQYKCMLCLRQQSQTGWKVARSYAADGAPQTAAASERAHERTRTEWKQPPFSKASIIDLHLVMCASKRSSS
eukprot:6203639-Pleurochrysis_carterae.AAC.2